MPEETINDIEKPVYYDPSRNRARPVLVSLDSSGVHDLHVLTQHETTLGRDPEADIQISTGTVSRIHAAVEYRNFNRPDETPMCLIVDKKSTNGTFLNGQRITGARPLKVGDSVMIGGCSLGYFLRTEAEIEADRQLRVLATRDALTNLANRGFMMMTFEREFERASRYQRPISLVMADLDHFKKVNDTFGHAGGDYVLQQVARLVTSTARSHDIAARYGGEEFAILLPETRPEGAVVMAERLRLLVENSPVHYQNEEIHLTISIGVAGLRDATNESLEMLIKRADAALYRAKEQGRNRVFADSLM